LAFADSSYFNITNGPTIDGTIIQLHSSSKQDVDDAKIPTGTTSPHPDLRLFTSSTPLAITLGESAPSFDHCFVLPDLPEPAVDTRQLPLREFARLFDEESRINLLASTTEPTFQFYTGDGIDVKGSGDKKTSSFGSRAGLCLEAGRPINAVNDPKARGWVVLKDGEIYGSYTAYSTWISP
jgi:aldose 1-epimerase